MFFIRAAFWLALVVALIPVNPSDLKEGQRSVSTAETVGLAQSVMADIGSFCERNDRTCETGGVLLSQMGIKAKEGARIAYSWLDDRTSDESMQLVSGKPNDMKIIDPVATSSVQK